MYTKGIASYYLCTHAATVTRVHFQYHHSRESSVYDWCVWVLFSSVVIWSVQSITVTLKNKRVKYSHNLIWGCAVIGKVQHCKQQIGNCRDSCTVAVKKLRSCFGACCFTASPLHYAIQESCIVWQRAWMFWLSKEVPHWHKQVKRGTNNWYTVLPRIMAQVFISSQWFLTRPLNETDTYYRKKHVLFIICDASDEF